jgi:hypothetical protein
VNELGAERQAGAEIGTQFKPEACQVREVLKARKGLLWCCWVTTYFDLLQCCESTEVLELLLDDAE